MENKLKGLKWEPLWTSHLGCIKGCTDFLDLDIPLPDLFGLTGHAFILNIAGEKVCPSSPTAWNTEMLFKLGENLGYRIEGIFGTKDENDFQEKKERAWEMIRESIDSGLPCYGWELHVPEYYVISGYTDSGYLFSGPCDEDVDGPKNWKEIADTEIGVLEMYSLKPGKPVGREKSIREALEFVVEFSRNSDEWVFPKYDSGQEGYDNWIQELEKGNADAHGLAYNSVLWNECRKFGVQFLGKNSENFEGRLKSLFLDAASIYSTVTENLGRICELFPFPPESNEVRDSRKIKKGIKFLREAKEFERKGLEIFEEIIKELEVK